MPNLPTLPTKAELSKLSPKKLYDRCKAVVDFHLEKFLAVGEALLIIKERELYKPEIAGKDGAETFTEFVEKNYQSRVRAFQMLSAADTRQILINNLELKQADAIWTCEYHFYSIAPLIRPLATDEELAGKVKEAFTKLKPEGDAEAIRAAYETALKEALDIPTVYDDKQAKAYTLKSIDSIHKMIQSKVSSIYEELGELADEKTIKDKLVKVLAGIADKIDYMTAEEIARKKDADTVSALDAGLAEAEKQTKKRLAKK